MSQECEDLIARMLTPDHAAVRQMHVCGCLPYGGLPYGKAAALSV